MNVLPCKVLLLLFSIGASGIVAGDDVGQARDWLERMNSAMNRMSYQGTFVYIRDGAVETMRITHVVDESGVRERLFSISGPRREVIRDWRGVRCLLDDATLVLGSPVEVDSYFPELPLAVIDGEDSGYHLETGGNARIAGQLARRVTIVPADGFRYGYDFWLQEESGLLLKWVLFGERHKVLAKLMFTDFVMGSEVDLAELESDSPTEDFVELKTFNPKKLPVKQNGPRWYPQELPPGFLLASYNNKTGVNGLYEHTVYSDGLAAVSVYIEQGSDGESITQGVSQLGTNNAFSRKQGGLQITVIGEVPALTVETIAQEMANAVAAN